MHHCPIRSVGELPRRDGRWHRLVGRIAVQIGQALGHNIDNNDDDDEDNNIEALASSMFGATNATIALCRIDIISHFRFL